MKLRRNVIVACAPKLGKVFARHIKLITLLNSGIGYELSHGIWFRWTKHLLLLQ